VKSMGSSRLLKNVEIVSILVGLIRLVQVLTESAAKLPEWSVSGYCLPPGAVSQRRGISESPTVTRLPKVRL